MRVWIWVRAIEGNRDRAHFLELLVLCQLWDEGLQWEHLASVTSKMVALCARLASAELSHRLYALIPLKITFKGKDSLQTTIGRLDLNRPFGSFALSTEAVASSSRTMGASLRIARAIAIRCFPHQKGLHRLRQAGFHSLQASAE